MAEYYIKAIKNSNPNDVWARGMRYGIYYDGILRGYYANYQQARRDMIRIREQEQTFWFTTTPIAPDPRIVNIPPGGTYTYNGVTYQNGSAHTYVTSGTITVQQSPVTISGITITNGI